MLNRPVSAIKRNKKVGPVVAAKAVSIDCKDHHYNRTSPNHCFTDYSKKSFVYQTRITF